jgi:hypothetical protein
MRAASPGGLPNTDLFFFASIAAFFGRPAPLGFFLGNTETVFCVGIEGASVEEDTRTISWSFVSKFLSNIDQHRKHKDLRLVVNVCFF